jgi:hypothetical protein
MATGHDAFNAALDQNSYYYWTMFGFDVAGVIGGGGAITDIIETRGALEDAGVGWRKAMSGNLTYRQRRAITEGMDLIGTTKTKGGPMIAAVVKQRLLAAVAAAVGMAGSATSGAIHDLVVWIVYPQRH